MAATSAAPLSKPHQKKIHKPITAPPMPTHVRHGKRPRPSDTTLEGLGLDDKIRKKDGMATTKLTTGKGEKGSSYRTGMYVKFIDDAFETRYQGDSSKYNELISQFSTLLPSTSSHPPPSSSTTPLASTSSPPSTLQIRTWLDALTHSVSKLDKTHAPLVETILSVPWATMDDGFVGAYIKFIGALASARAEWLKLILERCVKGLKYRSAYTTGSSNSMPTLTRRILYNRLHALLRMLISLIPTLSNTLSPILAQHFPSKREPKFAQICYIDNLLLIANYCPALTEDILGLVVDRALNIDVEIQGEPEEWEEVEEEMGIEATDNLGVDDIMDRPTAEDEDSDESDDEGDDGDELDLEDLDSDDEPDPIDDEEADRQAKGKGMSEAAIRKVLQSRAKLDAILKVVLDHLAEAYSVSPSPTSTPASADPGTPNSQETTPTPESPPSPQTLERRQSLFRTLLDIFDRTLLRTFKTRNTQFILFYLCSLDISFSDHFIGVLLARALFEVDAPAVTRVAAAGYVASFISRAAFVDAQMTRKVVKHLCQFMEVQMDDYANGASGQHLQVFYAVAQAVFYIFCFRWRDLLDEGDGEEEDLVLEPGRRWIMDLETVKKAVSSPFNPLKNCAPSVVTQFATIAQNIGFMYCFPIIATNRRAASRESAPANSTTTGGSRDSSLTRPRTTSNAPAPRKLLVAEEMDSFFPFDPFKLPLSSIYIDDIYRNWVGEDESASETTDSDDDSSSDDDEEISESEAETEYGIGLAVPGSGRRADDEDDQVARSFEAMSLSPDQPSFGGRSLPRPTAIVF